MIVRSEQSWATTFRTLAWAVLRFSGRFAKGDMTIEHKRKMWKRVDGYPVLLSKTRYLGGRKKCWAVVGVYIRPLTKFMRIIIAVHMPARVQAALREGRITVDTKAWEESLTRLGIEVAMLREKYPDARLDVVGDWNVAVEDAYFRNLISLELGLTPATPVDEDGSRLKWSDVPGTHTHRVIDWDWSTDPDATCQVRGATKASDHHPITVR